MQFLRALAVPGIVAVLLGSSLPVIAGDGHDHGDATPAAAAIALPRFAAVSEAFELVGVLDGRQLTLYLDRFADNAPVRGAQIDIEIAGARFQAEAQGDDTYSVVLKDAPKPGVLPVTATVTAGAETDLLAGDFDLHAPDHAGEAAHAPAWKEFGGWAAGGLAALAVLVLGSRRLLATRQLRAGGAA